MYHFLPNHPRTQVLRFLWEVFPTLPTHFHLKKGSGAEQGMCVCMNVCVHMCVCVCWGSPFWATDILLLHFLHCIIIVGLVLTHKTKP